MIKRFSTRVDGRKTPPAPPAPTTAAEPGRDARRIRAQRRKSADDLGSLKTPLITAERRRSLPVPESRKIRRARKRAAFAAGAFNAFPRERRPEMLAMAAQLDKVREQVETTWVALPSDERGARFMRFELVVDAEGAVVVNETLCRKVDGAAGARRPLIRFSAEQRRVGLGQLNEAFLWRSLNDQGFPQAEPDFQDLPPNEEASALSED